MAYEGWKKTAAVIVGIFAGLVEAPVRQALYVLDSASQLVQIPFATIGSAIVGAVKKRSVQPKIFTLFPREFEITGSNTITFSPFLNRLCPKNEDCCKPCDCDNEIVEVLLIQTRHLCPGILHYKEAAVSKTTLLTGLLTILITPISLLVNIFHRGYIRANQVYKLLSGPVGSPPPSPSSYQQPTTPYAAAPYGGALDASFFADPQSSYAPSAPAFPLTFPTGNARPEQKIPGLSETPAVPTGLPYGINQ